MVIEDYGFLSDDRQTIVTRSSIASDASISILINDSFFVPRSGLYSNAELHSSFPGPFVIRKTSNVLRIESNSDILDLILPISKLDTDDIAKIINDSGSNSIMAKNYNGHLVLFETKETGRESKISVSGNSVDNLGFLQNQNFGKMVFPGWRTISSLTPDRKRIIKFDSPIKSDPIIKLNYMMESDKCLRCNGSLTENDWTPDGHGDIVTIDNENLLYQASMKMMLTTKGSNPFHGWYGTDIKSRIGTKITGTLVSVLKEDIKKAILYIQKMQREQAKYQVVSFKERLYRINSIDVKQHENNPSMFLIDVNVQNASRENVNISIVFTVPGVLSTNVPKNITMGRVG